MQPQPVDLDHLPMLIAHVRLLVHRDVLGVDLHRRRRPGARVARQQRRAQRLLLRWRREPDGVIELLQRVRLRDVS